MTNRSTVPMFRMPGPGDVIGGKYRVDREVGRGANGIVYAAEHEITERKVALKWMPPTQAMDMNATMRFLREAKVAGKIDHPNVVEVMDVGREGDGAYLVMEFLHGAPLTALLDRGRLSPAEANEIMIPVMRGVAAAHGVGAVHRDLKPDNIFLCRGPDGRAREPKVLDFGLSKLSIGRESMSLTASGSMIGTPYYMAPEQISAAKEADARTDVYALGVILYEMIAGERPFEAETLPQLILNIVHGKPRPLHIVVPGVPQALSALVAKAMSVPSQKRFESVDEFARAIEPFGHTRYDLQGPAWSAGTVGRAYNVEGNTLPLKMSSQVGNPFAESDEHNTNIEGAAAAEAAAAEDLDGSTDRPEPMTASRAQREKKASRKASVVTPLQSVDIEVLNRVGKDSKILPSAFDSVSMPSEQRIMPEKPAPKWPYLAAVASVLLVGGVWAAVAWPNAKLHTAAAARADAGNAEHTVAVPQTPPPAAPVAQANVALPPIANPPATAAAQEPPPVTPVASSEATTPRAPTRRGTRTHVQVQQQQVAVRTTPVAPPSHRSDRMQGDDYY